MRVHTRNMSLYHVFLPPGKNTCFRKDHVSPRDHAAIVLAPVPPIRGPSFDPRYSSLLGVRYVLLKPQPSLLFPKAGVALVDSGITLPTTHLSERINFYRAFWRRVLPLYCPTYLRSDHFFHRRQNLPDDFSPVRRTKFTAFISIEILLARVCSTPDLDGVCSQLEISHTPPATTQPILPGTTGLSLPIDGPSGSPLTARNHAHRWTAGELTLPRATGRQCRGLIT